MVKERVYEKVHPIIGKAPTVNYHMLKACNMRCGFCFATYPEIHGKEELDREERLELIDELCYAGFDKINFAGGEPTLCRELPELIQRAKSHNVTTSIVTNGSRITVDWLKGLKGHLDFVTLSIDSVNSETQRNIGRVEKSKEPMTAERYLEIGNSVRDCGMRLKVNTVVNRLNHTEDMSSFVLAMQPERWKILQVLPVAGQNDTYIGEFTMTDGQFEQYVERHRGVENSGIVVVPEGNDLMTGSYVMVDPLGRFFDNTEGHHTYSSKPILEVGVKTALESVTVDTHRFSERGGIYP